MSRTERRPVRRPYRSRLRIVRAIPRYGSYQADRSRYPSRRFADLPEIIIDDSVHYDEPPTCRGFNFERSADCGGTISNDAIWRQAHLAPGLPTQPTPDVGVGHGIERVLLHAGFAQQSVVYEQMPHEKSSAGGRKGWANDSRRHVESFHQRFTDRADIAVRCRIER